MRVPNTGLDLETRVIVREGRRIAEYLLRDYRDPPGVAETVGAWLARGREATRGLYRALAGN